MIPRPAAALALAAIVAGCHPVRPSIEPVTVPATAIAVSQQRAWDAALEVLTESNLTLRMVEREAGFISTEHMLVERDRAAKWADCGMVIGGALRPDRATYNVLVRGDSARASVKVTTRFTQGGTREDPVIVECSSRGVWEKAMQERIRARAEAAVAGVGR